MAKVECHGNGRIGRMAAAAVAACIPQTGTLLTKDRTVDSGCRGLDADD